MWNCDHYRDPYDLVEAVFGVRDSISGERADVPVFRRIVRLASVPDAAFRMIGRATGARDRFPVTGRPGFQVGALV